MVFRITSCWLADRPTDRGSPYCIIKIRSIFQDANIYFPDANIYFPPFSAGFLSRTESTHFHCIFSSTLELTGNYTYHPLYSSKTLQFPHIILYLCILYDSHGRLFCSIYRLALCEWYPLLSVSFKAIYRWFWSLILLISKALWVVLSDRIVSCEKHCEHDETDCSETQLVGTCIRTAFFKTRLRGTRGSEERKYKMTEKFYWRS